MKDDGHGRPRVGTSGRDLGARIGSGDHCDIPCSNDGLVAPDTGGMSVYIHDFEEMPYHRKPRWLGGSSNDTLWRLDFVSVPSTLKIARPDITSHAFVEPGAVMEGDVYLATLASTATEWEPLYAW